MTNLNSYSPDDPLLTARQAAAELGIGVSTFWRDVGRGLLPKAYYISRKAPRWLRSEILAFVQSCPRGGAITPSSDELAINLPQRQ